MIDLRGGRLMKSGSRAPTEVICRRRGYFSIDCMLVDADAIDAADRYFCPRSSNGK